MHRLFVYAAFLASVAVCHSTLYAAADPASRPNILVFLADDVGWRDFGCYGNHAVRTPHIDRLAREGLRFENCFLTTAQCSPTRISVLTGRYPHATGAEDLHMPLPEGRRIVPSYLSDTGYFTGHMRKTHYGPHGMEQFDWYSQELTDFSQFLDAASGEPFFMWVGFKDAHRPYAPGAVSPPHDPDTVTVPPYLADTPATRADLALYYDEISRMDENIGAMLAELARREQLDETLVLFFSDNGAPFPRAKGTVYDSGVGTPLVVRWPGQVPPGTVHDGLASVIDLAPTLLQVAGVDAPASMQGTSMLATFRDPRQPGREMIFSERNWHNCDEHIRAVRTANLKLIKNAYLDVPYGNPADVSRSPSWHSLLERKENGTLTPGQAHMFLAPRPQYELYDLDKDPHELKNVADDPAYAEERAALVAALDEWSRTTGDFSPMERRRADNTDRVTGEKFTRDIAPLRK